MALKEACMKNYLNFYLILHEELQPFQLARNARRPIRNFFEDIMEKTIIYRQSSNPI